MKVILVLSALSALTCSASAAGFGRPTGRPIGREVEDPATGIRLTDEDTGRVIYERVFPRPVTKARALKDAEAAVAESFELMTSQDLEELTEDKFRMRAAGIGKKRRTKKAGDEEEDRWAFYLPWLEEAKSYINIAIDLTNQAKNLEQELQLD